MIYFAVCDHHLDGGVNITASHNPKEYNGFKLVGRGAHSICGSELKQILNLAQTQKLESKKGSLTKGTIFNDYLNKITNTIHLKNPLKIAIDAGNGAAGPFAPLIFRKMGIEVSELFTEPDGNFPNHEANPEYAENLKELSKIVKEKKLDLGIGFDGDGDRLGIINEHGEHISADFLIILLARDLLKRHPKAPIVHDIKCSNLVKNEISRLGGIPIMSKTGHSFIETKMREEKALLGGEVSGHIFLAENYYGFDDGIFAAAKILEILSKSSKKFSEHFHALPKMYNTPEIKAACPDTEKFEIVNKITDYFVTRYDCVTIDGVRVHFDQHSWGIIRCSNTSPCLTMRFEAKTREKLTEIQKIVFEKLIEYEKIDNSWYENK